MKTNSFSLKIDGWKKIHVLLKWSCYFFGQVIPKNGCSSYTFIPERFSRIHQLSTCIAFCVKRHTFYTFGPFQDLGTMPRFRLTKKRRSDRHSSRDKRNDIFCVVKNKSTIFSVLHSLKLTAKTSESRPFAPKESFIFQASISGAYSLVSGSVSTKLKPESLEVRLVEHKNNIKFLR